MTASVDAAYIEFNHDAEAVALDVTVTSLVGWSVSLCGSVCVDAVHHLHCTDEDVSLCTFTYAMFAPEALQFQ